MWIIGCDFHPSGQQVYTVNEQTGEIVERWLSHGGEEVDEFYRSVPAGSEVGVEASGNMLLFERKLARYGLKLRLGDAAKIRAKDTRKQKHDRRDAEHIYTLMRKQDFPDLQWVPTLQERDLRQLLLHRHKLVRMRAQVKNQLQHIALNQGQQKKWQLWTAKGQELLKKLELEPWTERRRNDLLQLLESLNGYCEGLDAAVEQEAQQRAAARLLMTHPGIG